MRPNLKISKQKKTILGFDKIKLIFITQYSAFVLMIIGFIIFVFMWYFKNK